MDDRIQLAFAITRAVEAEDGLLVEGLLLDEQLDKYGKIIDFARSRPFIEAWRDEIRAQSGGRSDGNVRVMHQLWPAGIVVPDGLLFDDAAKQVRAKVKVVEPDAKTLVLEGVLNTFSVGADVKERWRDTENPKVERLAIAPVEMSLVDNPGQYRSEGFEIVRANGAVERVPFKARPAGVPETVRTAATALLGKGRALLERVRAAGATDGTPLVAQPATVRGMWDVGRLAALLEELRWLTEIQENERAAEGDASAVPNRLAALVIALGDVLVTMTVEEVDELTARFREDAGDAVTLAAEAADQRAIAALATGTLARSVMHPKHLRRAQRMHDWLCELGAACVTEDDDETMERAAVPAAPVEEDGMELKDLLAAGPELARAMGIEAGIERAVKPVQEALDGVRGEVTELRRTVDAQAETITKQDERLKTVEGQPGPTAGVVRGVVATKDGDRQVVTTGADATLADDPRLPQAEREQRALKRMAKKLAGPGQPLTGARPMIAAL